MQALCGCLAPIAVHVCSHVRAAVEYAEERGMSPDNPRYRRMRSLNDKMEALYVPARIFVLFPAIVGCGGHVGLGVGKQGCGRQNALDNFPTS